MEDNALHCAKEEDITNDGGSLTGFTPIEDIETQNNKYGIVEVWWSGKSDGANPAQFTTGNGNFKSYSVIRKDILTYGEAISVAEELATKYTDFHRSIKLQFGTYSFIKPAYLYDFTLFGTAYTDQICRRVSYSYVDGKWTIVGYFGGGSTPDDEYIGKKFGELSKKITDSQVLEMTSGFLPANSWSQITGKPTTFTPAAHAASHESGGADEVNHDDLAGFESDEHFPWADVTGAITTHTEDVDAHHARYEDSEAIAAVEGEPTLDCTGYVKAKDHLTDVQSYVVTDDQKGEPLGIPTLDAYGKIYNSYVPAFQWGQYLDMWDASGAAYPADPDNVGDYYICSIGGTVDGIAYTIGDVIIWDGREWDKIDSYSAYSDVYNLFATYFQAHSAIVKTLEVRGKHHYEIPYICNMGQNDDWLTNGVPTNWTETNIEGLSSCGIGTKDGLDRVLIYECSPVGDTDVSLVPEIFNSNAETEFAHFDFYIYPDSTSDASPARFLFTINSKIDGAGPGAIIWIVVYSSGQIVCTFSGGFTLSGGVGSNLFNSTPDNWHYVSLQFTSGHIAFYVDLDKKYSADFSETATFGTYSTISFNIHADGGDTAKAAFAGVGSTIIYSQYVPFSSQDVAGLGQLTLDDVTITEILDSSDAFSDSDEKLMTAAAIQDLVDGYVPIANVSAFRANKTATQSISNSSAVVVTWTLSGTTPYHNIGEDFSDANDRYIAPADGVYAFHAQLCSATLAWQAGEIFVIILAINGTAVAEKSHTVAVDDTFSIMIDIYDEFDLNANDYVQVKCYHNFGTAQNIYAHAKYNHFCGHRVS
jgi:hypothetical protein